MNELASRQTERGPVAWTYEAMAVSSVTVVKESMEAANLESSLEQVPETPLPLVSKRERERESGGEMMSVSHFHQINYCSQPFRSYMNDVRFNHI